MKKFVYECIKNQIDKLTKHDNNKTIAMKKQKQKQKQNLSDYYNEYN
jgi:hypothetical protein